MQEYWLLTNLIALAAYGLIGLFLIIGLHHSRSETGDPMASVSVIVAARNEENDLETCLTALTRQNYPPDRLEIVLVDDRSTDRTGEIGRKLAADRPMARYIPITGSQAITSSKKRALEIGIAGSSGEILLFTDADCIPPPDWVKSLVANMVTPVGIVIGFSPLHASRSQLWSKILFVDSLFTAVLNAASCGWGYPLGATGRSLAYARRVFEQVQGYNAIRHSISGDDDLFVQLTRRKTRWKIAYAFARASMVPAKGPETVLAFLRQKARHISASKFFPTKIKLFYGLYHLSNMVLWISLIASIFYSFYPVFFAIAMKYLLDWINLKAFANKFSLKVPAIGFIIWQPFFMIYHFISGWNGFFGTIRWKE